MASQTEAEPKTTTAHGPEAPAGHPDDAASSLDDGVADKERPVAVSFWQKAKRHFRRWWWIYLIAVVILLAILLPVIFKVIIPAIIKNVVDDQELPVRGGALNFTNPTRLHVTLNTSLDTPLGVKIDPLPLSLLQPSADGDDDSGRPFLTLQMPEQHINHQTNVSIPDQIVDILDNAQLVAWFNQYFDKETVELRIKADDLSTHLGALHYKVHLDKTIKVQGLNYLKGFGVQDMQFTIPPGPSGRNMKGHLNIPNAGVLTLGLGNVTFNVVAGGINLGLVYIYNLDLKPGNNTAPFEGDFYFDELVPNLVAFLDAQQGALADGMIEFNATGNSSTHSGQEIKYLESVLNQKHIPFRIPATSLVLDVLSGVLAGGTNSSQQLPLLDTLGHVLANKTLFEQMLGHFEGTDTYSEGVANATAAAKVKRTAVASLGTSMEMKLVGLGLSRLRSRIR
ncbi:hypothetical protein VTK56DRAFT_10125 [Thermocarpiscus australiensis]